MVNNGEIVPLCMTFSDSYFICFPLQDYHHAVKPHILFLALLNAPLPCPDYAMPAWVLIFPLNQMVLIPIFGKLMQASSRKHDKLKAVHHCKCKAENEAEFIQNILIILFQMASARRKQQHTLTSRGIWISGSTNKEALFDDTILYSAISAASFLVAAAWKNNILHDMTRLNSAITSCHHHSITLPLHYKCHSPRPSQGFHTPEAHTAAEQTSDGEIKFKGAVGRLELMGD